MAGTVVQQGTGFEITVNTYHIDRLINTAFRSFNAVLRAAAFEVQALAKMTAPVDTGALANSIKVYDEGSDAGAVFKIGPSVHYAIYQEMGWTAVSKAGIGWHVPGKWYMTNALLTETPRVYEAMRQMLGGGGIGSTGMGGLGTMSDKGNK